MGVGFVIKVSREWVTPLTLGVFSVMAATGVLLFFHLDTGLNKTAHEWLGWLLVAAVVAHASVNWVSLRRYLLNSRRAQGVLVVSALVLAGSFVVGGKKEAPSPPALVMRAITKAPLKDVAPLAGKTLEQVQSELAALGLPAADGDQTLQRLTGNDRARTGEALRVLFAPKD
jgi:hypothetical protein